jgi:hypothetical protein
MCAQAYLSVEFIIFRQREKKSESKNTFEFVQGMAPN